MSSQYCLYIVVLIALLYNRNNAPFDSSYFKLWINLGLSIECTAVDSFCTGFIDLITAVWHSFWSRIYYYGFLEVVDVFPVCFGYSYELTVEMQPNSTIAYLRVQVGFAGMYYIGQLQYVGVAVMAVNRYTSVAQPMAHKTVLNSVVGFLFTHFIMLTAVDGRSPENRLRVAVHFSHRCAGRLSHSDAQSVHSRESRICKERLTFAIQLQYALQSLPFFVTLVMSAILTSSVIVLQAITVGILLEYRKQKIVPTAAGSTHANTASAARTTNDSEASKKKLSYFAVQCAEEICLLFLLHFEIFKSTCTVFC